MSSCSAPLHLSVGQDDTAPPSAEHAETSAPAEVTAAGTEPEAPAAEEEAPAAEPEVLEERRGGRFEGLEPEDELVWLGTKLRWDHGARLDTIDGDLSFVLGGRLHLDAAAFSSSQAITDEFGEPESGLNVRRAFLDFGALAYERYEFRLMVDFSGSTSLRDLYAGVLDLPVVGGVRAGYFKEPFGLEWAGSSNDLTFMERGLTNALGPNRNLGVAVTRNLTGHRVSTGSLGIYRSANGDLETGDGWSITGRVTALPVFAQDGRRLVHLGASASYRQPSDGTLRFRARPESHQAQHLANTGQFAADRDVRMGLELGAVVDSVSFQSEVILASAHGPAEVGSPLFPAAYFMGSYVLTGEERSYRRNIGVFGRVHPERKTGAVELALRYSWIDLDSDGVQGGSLFDVTTGVNWYVNHYVRLMFNYISARPEGFGTEHVFQTRLQIAL